jgi:hypothetical protein
MGATGSHVITYLNWCPSGEHRYVPIEMTHHNEIELLHQQICTIQTDMKQLVNRIEHTEQTIATFTQQLVEMADTDMVIIRS